MRAVRLGSYSMCATVAGTPQGGVISPLLSNVYLHVLDDVWMRRSPNLGVLVRYADDFVVMRDTKAACERAEQRVRDERRHQRQAEHRDRIAHAAPRLGAVSSTVRRMSATTTPASTR